MDHTPTDCSEHEIFVSDIVSHHSFLILGLLARLYTLIEKSAASRAKTPRAKDHSPRRRSRCSCRTRRWPVPPSAEIRLSAMATLPLNAALPVPSMVVPPRITMSCMPTSRMGAHRRRNLFAFDVYCLTVACETWACDAVSLPCSDTTQFLQRGKSGDSCSAPTDRPDERLNVRDRSFAPL
jgi:hypothetical protein